MMKKIRMITSMIDKYKLIYFLVQCFITLGCAWILHITAEGEGFRMPMSVLLVPAILLVIIIKVWTFDNERMSS